MLIRILRKPRGEHTSRRAGTDDDVVENIHSFSLPQLTDSGQNSDAPTATARSRTSFLQRPAVPVRAAGNRIRMRWAIVVTEPGIPTVCELVLEGGPVVMLGPEPDVTTDGAVAGGVIVDVGERAELATRWEPRRRLNTRNGTIHPGFTDFHVHMGSFLSARPPPPMHR